MFETIIFNRFNKEMINFCPISWVQVHISDPIPPSHNKLGKLKSPARIIFGGCELLSYSLLSDALSCNMGSFKPSAAGGL